MDVTSTPAGECVIVDCWRKKKEDPFIFVADFDADDEPYDYFYPAQNALLSSMMAYHHRFTRRQGGFILTMDSTQAGLFSSDAAEECRVLLPAISRRIELEFSAASGDSPTQPQSSQQS